MIYINLYFNKINTYVPNSIKSDTVFSLRKDELLHSSNKTSKTSKRVSILKHFLCPCIGPPKKIASNCLSRLSPN